MIRLVELRTGAAGQ